MAALLLPMRGLRVPGRKFADCAAAWLTCKSLMWSESEAAVVAQLHACAPVLKHVHDQLQVCSSVIKTHTALSTAWLTYEGLKWSESDAAAVARLHACAPVREHVHDQLGVSSSVIGTDTASSTLASLGLVASMRTRDGCVLVMLTTPHHTQPVLQDALECR